MRLVNPTRVTLLIALLALMGSCTSESDSPGGDKSPVDRRPPRDSAPAASDSSPVLLIGPKIDFAPLSVAGGTLVLNDHGCFALRDRRSRVESVIIAPPGSRVVRGSGDPPDIRMPSYGRVSLAESLVVNGSYVRTSDVEMSGACQVSGARAFVYVYPEFP